ncbi:Hypothetical protein NTJ_01272 [Nesidiocoris tenuis]|uniref:Uncharacterized protein n=1 Tax=Nesidiocoris tenuis TaxID=355587 RepID=A0ABN7A862_9HEMI|nr:Hypothetical protein NTJ_01272 [Nesidiocoris tenuis]
MGSGKHRHKIKSDSFTTNLPLYSPAIPSTKKFGCLLKEKNLNIKASEESVLSRLGGFLSGGGGGSSHGVTSVRQPTFTSSYSLAQPWRSFAKIYHSQSQAMSMDGFLFSRWRFNAERKS